MTYTECINARFHVHYLSIMPIFRIPCDQRTIPVRLLLTINPPKHWLDEEGVNGTNSAAKTETPVASFIGERVLKVDDKEVRAFYQRSARFDAATSLGLSSTDSDETMPFLFLTNAQTAICRDPANAGRPPSQAELTRATSVRLAFRVSY